MGDLTLHSSSLPAISRPETNPAKVFIARLAPGTRPTVQSTINFVATILSTDPSSIIWGQFRREHTLAIRATMMEGNPYTANKKISHIKGILKEAMLLGQMSQDEYYRASSVPPIKGTRKRKGRAMSREEIASVLATQDIASAFGARNACLFALGVGCGVRVSEMAHIILGRLNLDKSTLRVLGKGNKEREIPIPTGTRRYIENWLLFRGKEPGALLCEITRYGAIHVHPLSRPSIQEIVDKMTSVADIKRITTHDFRRTYITHLFELNVDASTIKDLAGHSQIQTTIGYDRRGDQRLVDATDRIDIPFPE